MQIQINHDNHTIIAADTSERLQELVESSLSQFADRITRIQMHLSDANAGKHGDGDKRCLLEARVSNLQPIAVSHQSQSLRLAIDGAISKLEHALSHAIGKLATH